MRRPALIAVLALAALAVVLAGLGLQDWLARNAMAMQKQAQNALAGALRALRAGQPGAVSGFLALCFTHGFLHALGPGHGKAVIAAYGAISGAGLRRLVGIAAASSLAQAGTAVAIVYAAVWLLDGTREHVEGLAARIEPLSFALIAALGVMLLWRGVRRLVPALRAPAHSHDHHDHGHDHHHHDAHCGCDHVHGPDVDAVLAARGWRDAGALIVGVALRPCTSALFLLILTWRLDLDAIGIVGAFVMGLGTMMVTMTAALLAVLMRRGVVMMLPEGRGMAMALAGFEAMAGLAIAVTAGGAALQMI